MGFSENIHSYQFFQKTIISHINGIYVNIFICIIVLAEMPRYFDNNDSFFISLERSI